MPCSSLRRACGSLLPDTTYVDDRPFLTRLCSSHWVFMNTSQVLLSILRISMLILNCFQKHKHDQGKQHNENAVHQQNDKHYYSLNVSPDSSTVSNTKRKYLRSSLDLFSHALMTINCPLTITGPANCGPFSRYGNALPRLSAAGISMLFSFISCYIEMNTTTTFIPSISVKWFYWPNSSSKFVLKSRIMY